MAQTIPDAARRYHDTGSASWCSTGAVRDQAGPDAADAGPCGRLLTHMLIGRMPPGSFAAAPGLVRTDPDARLAGIVGDRIRGECPDQATGILVG
jgi:hypothetical protein